MENYLCGYIGGICGTLVSYPIDTLRIRRQSNIKTFSNLYSGILTPMIGIGLGKAIIFGVYNQTYKYTKNDLPSGLNSGLFASLVITPIEKINYVKD